MKQELTARCRGANCAGLPAAKAINFTSRLLMAGPGSGMLGNGIFLLTPRHGATLTVMNNLLKSFTAVSFLLLSPLVFANTQSTEIELSEEDFQLCLGELRAEANQQDIPAQTI
ncbi:MAG: hypothetical protein MI751_13670, partial [Pseudomonadales bacterium]|nr:hypothetical protein [Pseudomonadales bacterium]